MHLQVLSSGSGGNSALVRAGHLAHPPLEHGGGLRPAPAGRLVRELKHGRRVASRGEAGEDGLHESRTDPGTCARREGEVGPDGAGWRQRG